jgi:hypothetical protein
MESSIEKVIDSLCENHHLAQVNIRIDKATDQVSVIDIIQMMTGLTPKRASEVIINLSKQIKFPKVRINGKGRLTPVADGPTLIDIISMLPGKKALRIQSVMAKQGYELKRKVTTLLQTGSATFERETKRLKLDLKSAQLLDVDGRVMDSWNYLSKLNPPHKKVFNLIQEFFPTEFKTNEDDKNQIGFVYFIRISGTHMVKIGYTCRNIHLRLSQLQVANPQDLEVLITIRTKMFKEMERSLHQKFHTSRVRGEWFVLLDEDIENCFNEIKN